MKIFKLIFWKEGGTLKGVLMKSGKGSFNWKFYQI